MEILNITLRNFPKNFEIFSIFSRAFHQQQQTFQLFHHVIRINLNEIFFNQLSVASCVVSLQERSHSLGTWSMNWVHREWTKIFRFNFCELFPSVHIPQPQLVPTPATTRRWHNEWMQNVWEKRQSRRTIIQLNHEVASQFNLIFKELFYPIIGLFVAVFHRFHLFLLLLWVFFPIFSSPSSSSPVVHFTPINLSHLFDFSKGLSTILINSIIDAWIIYRQLITMFDDRQLITDEVDEALTVRKISLTFSYTISRQTTTEKFQLSSIF